MKRVLLVLLACGAMSGAVLAQTVSGDDLAAGDTATTIAEKIGAGWQQGGGACRILPDPNDKAGEGIPPTSVILQVDQFCPSAKSSVLPRKLRRIDYTIELTNVFLTEAHCYSIQINCDEGSQTLGTFLDFERPPSDGCDTPEQCPPGGACFFDDLDENPPGEADEITVSTVESAAGPRIDLLGTTGVIALAIGLLGVGFFLIIRRGFAV